MTKQVDFSKNKKALKMPWVESPFFNSILVNEKIEPNLKILAQKFHNDGYIIIDLEEPDSFYDKIISDIDKKLKSQFNLKKNPKIYHYNDSPRIVEGWKFCPEIKILATHPKIISLLKYLYDSDPIPINTLNFVKGTDQPLHSDYMHFSTIPEKYLAAAWVALQDINENNGPILVVPGSHKLPIIDYFDLNTEIPSSISELKEKYTLYEGYVDSVVNLNNLEVKEMHLKKGQAVIWAANMLHGGKKIIDQNTTRFSQVTHFHFECCDKYYNPNFSNAKFGNFKERNVEDLNIFNN